MASDGPKFETPELPVLGRVRATVTLLDGDTPGVVFIDDKGQAVSTFGVSDVLFENIRIAVLTALGPVGTDPTPLIVNGPGDEPKPDKPKKGKKGKKDKRDKYDADDDEHYDGPKFDPDDFTADPTVEPIDPADYPTPAEGDVDVSDTAHTVIVNTAVTIDRDKFGEWWKGQRTAYGFDLPAADALANPDLVADFIADTH